DDASRGFGFSKDGPLDMRMDRSRGLNASQWLAQSSEQEIVRVLKKYGEERFATRIARGVLAHMAEHGPIATTAELVELVIEAIPVKEKNKHPATRTFQAIRIEVNGELDQVASAMEQALELLKPGGRLVVISFHSLEDRIVKRFIKKQEKGDQFPAKMPVRTVDLNQRMKRIGKQIRAGEQELAINRRARSAVLRIAEKIV
ncbi:MAG: 16S rRNA (cytosine(1402)-N(4))-methyltransferase RsmH, partial [Pseudomonadales bacterium]|nr:16S rRNA (cytosine(1402)-N(4))-methyltransferase RsmH [Pseudomonadales bacterium]